MDGFDGEAPLLSCNSLPGWKASWDETLVLLLLFESLEYFRSVFSALNTAQSLLLWDQEGYG